MTAPSGSPYRSVSVPGIEQAMMDSDNAISSGQLSLQAVEGERAGLAVAFQSQRAFPPFNQAIVNWQTNFEAVLNQLRSFRLELDEVARRYAAGDSAAGEHGQQLAQQQVASDGLPGF
jgi:hypothetical protein